MRVVHAAAFTAAALLLTSMASAQGIGAAAAKERERRKAAASGAPVKVITEQELSTVRSRGGTVSFPGATGGTEAGTPAATEPGATPAGTEGAATEGEAEKPKTDAELMAEAEAEKEKAQAAWREERDRVQKELEAHQSTADRLNVQLNDFRYGFNTPDTEARQKQLAEAQAKVTEAQARLEVLDEQARREGYR